MAYGVAHKHFAWPQFNRSHTALHMARKSGAKHAEYLPLLRRANEDARLFSVMLFNWGDPIC